MEEYCEILGGRTATKSLSKISRKMLGASKLDITRSGFAENKLEMIAYGIFG
jgi:hypothetical protein